jgi:hypothetical protein
MNTTTDEPVFTTTEPLVKLGQGDTEMEYFPDMFYWTEYLMGIVTGAVVVGLAAAFL